jgi:hypothetical protein
VADTDYVQLVGIGGMVPTSRGNASVVPYHFTSAVYVRLDCASRNGESGSMPQMRSGRDTSCKEAEVGVYSPYDGRRRRSELPHGSGGVDSILLGIERASQTQGSRCCLLEPGIPLTEEGIEVTLLDLSILLNIPIEEKVSTRYHRL